MSIPIGEQVLGTGGALGSVTVTSGTIVLGGGTANIGIAVLFRDNQVTVQNMGTTGVAPVAGTTVVTVTPGTAGFWEVSGQIWVSATTVAATDTNNMELMQTSTARLNPIMGIVPGTAGMAAAVPFPGPSPLILQLSAADTVNVKVIGNASVAAVYSAQIVCRRVG